MHLARRVARGLRGDRRAAGVVLAGGDEVAARAVVSGADPLTTADLAGVAGRKRSWTGH